MSFLTVLVKDVGDLLPTAVVYQLGCAETGRRVETHIQRAVVPESKTPGRSIQLKAAETQIKQDAVNSRKTPLAGDSIHLVKWRLGHAQSAGADFAGKALPNSSDGCGVNVQPQYFSTGVPICTGISMRPCSGGARVLQQELGMAAAAQSSVNETSAWLDVQAGQHFIRQNGAVLEANRFVRGALHVRRGSAR